MTRLHLVALVGAIAVAACGKKPPPRPHAAAAPVVAAPAPALQAEQKTDKPAAEWTYSSVGKRDPFRSFLAEVESSGQTIASRCASPLGRFELDQLRLVAIVTGLEDPVAMVEAPNGIGYSLRQGACVGRNGGVIAAVRGGEVVVSEWAIRADGSREKTQTILRLPKQESLNIEE